MQDRIFYSTCFGFLMGVLLRSFLFVNFYFALFLVFLGISLILYFSLVKFKWGIVFPVCLVAFSFGILRFHIVDVAPSYIYESHIGQRVSLVGEIVDEPSVGEKNQKLTIEVSSPKTVFGEYGTQILVSTNLEIEYKYGDEVEFSGILKKPENFTTDQGKVFDYINYLRKDGIYYVMSYPKIEIISHDNGNRVKSALFSVKKKFLEKMNMVIDSPEDLLMSGLILGEKASFSQDLRKSFIDTGTIHIVALSGYNVTIVAEWVMKLFAHISFIPKSFGIGVGIFIIILFILMTGGSSTAVRAGIMATLALVARATGRNYDVGRALLLAGVAMIALNPFLLVFDVSFQLSFIATIAVIFYAPRIEKYFLWVTEKFKLRDIVSVTVAVYIFVMPFILYKMGNLSLVALPANILILPLIPFTMGLGFITGLFGLVSYMFSVPLGYLSYLFLHYELSVISFFSQLSFASFAFPDFPMFLTILIYMYFAYFLFGRSLRNYLKE